MRAGWGFVLLLAGASAGDTPPAAIAFEDVSSHAGIDAVLDNAPTPQKHQIETMPGGVAVLDFDGDGLLDLFVTNGAAANRLYRNRGNGTFEDVTAKAGIAGDGFRIGVAAADYDNDGHPDLFVAGVSRNFLYRNRGDGTFEDVTAKAGIHGESWSVGGGWFDYDGDGRLDLFVVNYVEWDPATEPVCKDEHSGEVAHCHPKFYKSLPNTLYHNNGDGTFTDVSESAGIRKHTGKGMAVAFADYDGDGRVDIFVANDSVPNFLFHNDGNGKFTESALEAGVAVNDDGRAVSSMGVDFRDFDNDGRPDLFITALVNETYPLYRNVGKGLFADFTYRSKVGAATALTTGWANGIFDFDNDGRKDLFAVNGDLNENAEALTGHRARQPLTSLRQMADGTFQAAEFGPMARYRGAAFGDFDNDGRVDVVVTRLGEKPVVLMNRSAPNHWLGFQLVGRRSNRDGIGAVIHVKTAAGEQWNQLTTAVGYASSSDVRVHFGLGTASRAWVEVRWPKGTVQKLGEMAADRYVVVREPGL